MRVPLKAPLYRNHGLLEDRSWSSPPPLGASRVICLAALFYVDPRYLGSFETTSFKDFCTSFSFFGKVISSVIAPDSMCMSVSWSVQWLSSFCFPGRMFGFLKALKQSEKHGNHLQRHRFSLRWAFLASLGLIVVLLEERSSGGGDKTILSKVASWEFRRLSENRLDSRLETYSKYVARVFSYYCMVVVLIKWIL